uniref:C2H2-type domain-containing protein n=1 Tax=Knipowitschia caucasica TaxID=637954 RepID=A0AAV2JE40_KNICA
MGIRIGEVGLPVCMEMCIQALKMSPSDHKESKSSICKTISCLLPSDLEICTKTFTRTTGLRIHYEKVHRLSREDMQRLKIRARNKRPHKPDKNDGAICRSIPDICVNPTVVANNAVMAVKPELLDVAIASPPYRTQEPVPRAFPAPGHGETGGYEMSTVTQLPPAPPQNYFNDLTVPILPIDAPEAAVITSLESPMRSPGAKERKRHSDWSLQCTKEAGYASPERPSSSKYMHNNGETSKKENTPKKSGPKMCELDIYSPYRPYRCVHGGCTAAFTIQQNLILHYRAMHQESLPLSMVEAEQNESSNFEDGLEKEPEVRCQVKNCSRGFDGVPTLVQHYLLLHKYSRDKTTSVMANMNIGEFNCNRPDCELPFSSVEEYIEHIRHVHKEIAISESGLADVTFKCEYEGCCRVYSTKSNLLRHLIKKHGFVYDPKVNDGRKNKTAAAALFPFSCSEKEHLEKPVKTKDAIKNKEAKRPEREPQNHVGADKGVCRDKPEHVQGNKERSKQKPEMEELEEVKKEISGFSVRWHLLC